MLSLLEERPRCQNARNLPKQRTSYCPGTRDDPPALVPLDYIVTSNSISDLSTVADGSPLPSQLD